MKKLINILIIAALFLSTGCSKDEGPKAEDHFLNYDIPEVPVTESYTTGAFYYEVGTFNPNIKENPLAGKYTMVNGVVPPALMNKHLEYAAKAGLNYLVFSFRSASRDNNAFRRDSAIIQSYLDVVGEQPVNFALAYNFQSGTYGLSATAPLENDAVKLEQFYKDFERVAYLFASPKYMQHSGKRLLYIQNAQNLFSNNNPAVYTTLRQRLAALGFELYIVGMQDRWTPPARYVFRYKGCVDAIYHQNFRPDGYDRFYLLPQMMDQNWKYSKKYFADSLKVDYVPNVFPAYNYLIQTPTSLNPNITRSDNGEMYKQLCNVAKMNAGNNRLILIDAFNKWDEDLQIEPAESYGELYLDITRTQFKK
ncbi:glycoside hydrolase family 99-like domain-containing protein [uncultured Chitinophaga sp.]|uniref:glycoside hydrolase family 99-like domain-containing protein n=1 Tax=uncultured Chitinophaga sp. TaxID=339340 RepID=UPI0025FF46C5|nr:glycoside hydrolase family 99-like domain-containing protein [uncultured Chitinophaga sp.]